MAKSAYSLPFTKFVLLRKPHRRSVNLSTLSTEEVGSCEAQPHGSVASDGSRTGTKSHNWANVMKWLLLSAVAMLIGACAVNYNLERLSQTEFRPIGDSAFEFKALSSPLLRPEDSIGAEEERIRWLESYLDDNDLCPDGYEITQRRTVLLLEGLLGSSHDIYYSVRCKT